METFKFVRQPVLSFFELLFIYLFFIKVKRVSGPLLIDTSFSCVCKETCDSSPSFSWENCSMDLYQSFCGFHKKVWFIVAVTVRRSSGVGMECTMPG